MPGTSLFAVGRCIDSVTELRYNALLLCVKCNIGDCSSFPFKQFGDADSRAQWPHLHQVRIVHARHHKQSVHLYLIPRGTQLCVGPCWQNVQLVVSEDRRCHHLEGGEGRTSVRHYSWSVVGPCRHLSGLPYSSWLVM